jgi:DNA-binding NtrC family response regulator
VTAGRRILIVDDEAILLLSIRQELRLKFGNAFDYKTALSAEAGLETIDSSAAEGSPVVLVISDWLMPGMRGDEFLRRVHDSRPEIKLVMMSGHADSSQLERLSAEAGLFASLRKPYNSRTLFDVVQRATAG